MNIEEIKQHLTEKKYDAAIITRNNHFIGQDVLDKENLILQLTGFSGSAGILIVTREKSYLFVDGRYELQAPQQVNPQETEVICSTKMSLTEWLEQHFSKKAKIEYNPWCITVKNIENLQTIFRRFKFIPKAETYATETANAFYHELRYCGLEHQKKYEMITDLLKQHDCEACLISSADSVSWLTNLRSDALPETPIIRAMALVQIDQPITLFADELNFPTDCPYKVLPFSKIEKEISTVKDLTFALDTSTAPEAVCKIFEKHKIKTKLLIDPCLDFKACKNETEIKGMIDAHMRDGIAVCKFLYWFKHLTQDVTELEVVEKIHELRKQQPLFFSESFATIAAFDSNSAVIHYQPTRETNLKSARNSLLLLDSGGQYFNGTTDITRTTSRNAPTTDMVEKFTLVLKAHIALASAHFPQNTSGNILDGICRQVLWRHGLDFNHGTGHGVGCFLNVHEGPQSISRSGSNYPLKENMVVSIEPGFYEAERFGIRIENLVRVIADEKSHMLKFATLTLAPLDKLLIDKYLLNSEETDWINNYHHEVYQKISPYLTEEEQEWLKESCSPL